MENNIDCIVRIYSIQGILISQTKLEIESGALLASANDLPFKFLELCYIKVLIPSNIYEDLDPSIKLQ